MPDLKPLPPRPRPLNDPPAKKPPLLTFTDGLNFGCGFFVAGFLFTLLAVPAGMIWFLVLGALTAAGGR